MARLPNPGGDNGNWGTILNDYLLQAHKSDGTLKDNVVGASQLVDNAVTSNAIAPNSITGSAIATNTIGANNIADGSITEVLLEPSVQAKLNATGATNVLTTDAWVPIGYRSRSAFNSSGNYPATTQSNGINLGASFKMMDVAQISGRDLVVEFALFLNTNATEAEITNDVTITRCVFTTDNGLNVPFLFNGSTSITVKSGTYGAFRVRSDPLGFVVNKGTVFSIITNVSVASGGVYPLTVVARRGNYEEGAAAGGVVAAGPTTDMTANGQTWSAAAGSVRMFAPAALLTRPRKPSSVVLFVGDSISVGTGETISNVTGLSALNAHWDEGWCTRAVRDRWPHYVCGMSGTSLEKWYTNNGRAAFRRKSVLAGFSFTHIVNELGVNDFISGSGSSLATVQQRWWTAWNDLGAYSRPIYQTTLTPGVTTSSDLWTTISGQVVDANAAALASGNEWLRDGAPWNINTNSPAAVGASGASIVRAGEYWTTVAGTAVRTTFTTATGHPLAGILEVADAVESSRGSGKWKVLVGSRSVTDATIVSSSTTLSSASAAFTSNDLGRVVSVLGAGSAGGTLTAYITAVTDSSTVTLSAAASTTISSNGTARISPYGTTADGVHPSGTAGPDKGGHELIADFIRPQLVEILGDQSV